MTKEDVKMNKGAVTMLSEEEGQAVSGGTQNEEDYAVTADEICPYCGSPKVYKAGMIKNIGFTKTLREYKCRACDGHFWRELNG